MKIRTLCMSLLAEAIVVGVTVAGAAGGRLLLDSEPSDAEVFLDGRLVGQTPYQGEVSAGEHEVFMDRRGYRRWEARYVVAEGGAVEEKVELKRKVSVLRLTTRPASAAAVVDGDYRGRTPLDVELAAGPHELLVELSGYGRRRLKFDAWNGGVKELELRLRPDLKAIQKWQLGFLAGGAVSTLLYNYANNRIVHYQWEYIMDNVYVQRSATREEQEHYYRRMSDDIHAEEVYTDIRDISLISAISCAGAALALYAYEDGHFYRFVDHFVWHHQTGGQQLACRVGF